jgi:hypothetical protein
MSNAVFAACADYNAMVDALVRRADQLGISCNDIDLIAGLASGHAAKIMGPSQVKKAGAGTLFLLAPALGLRLAFLVDEEATHRYRDRYLKRENSQVRRSVFTHPPNERVVQRVLRHLAESWNWQDILSAVSEARKTLAAERAAKAAKEEAESAAKAAKPPPARAAAPPVRFPGNGSSGAADRESRLCGLR